MKKQTVKIFGQEVTVGTKKYERLMQDYRRYNDLAAYEQGNSMQQMKSAAEPRIQ